MTISGFILLSTAGLALCFELTCPEPIADHVAVDSLSASKAIVRKIFLV